MKKLMIVLLALISLGASAQDNNVCFNITNLLLTKPTVSYERGFARGRFGLQGNVGVYLPIIGNRINDEVNFGQAESDGNDVDVDAKFRGITFVPEFRVYPRGKMKGFYFGPYLKFAHRAVIFEGDTDVSGYDTEAEIKTAFNTIGLGFQLGTQWIIADKVSIDWYWMALGVSRNVLKLRVETEEDIDFSQWEEDMEADTEDLPGNIKIDSGDNFAEAKVPFFFPNSRFGLSVGFMF